MELLIEPVVLVVAHEVDTAAHPTVPPGWRWAVHVSPARDQPPAPDDLTSCVNAGWDRHRGDALVTGEMVGSACVKALRACGVQPRYIVSTLDHDPIRGGGDQISVG